MSPTSGISQNDPSSIIGAVQNGGDASEYITLDMYPRRFDLITMSIPNGSTSTGSPHPNGNNSDSPRDTEAGTPANGSEYASDSADETSSMVELSPEEFPLHFSERDNHLFHSSSSPYPLPVDGPEQQVLPLFIIANVAPLNLMVSDLIPLMIYCSSFMGRIT